MQTEFIKSGDFYKAELAKSFEKRKLLEAKIGDAKLEHSSFGNLLQASRSEHESANKMLDSAKTRLGNLDDMEQKVIELEAENAALRELLQDLVIRIDTTGPLEIQVGSYTYNAAKALLDNPTKEKSDE